jgi:YidC/Oxa1 family membrane protein insertase
MEKRAVIAVVLSIAVFYAFSMLFPQLQKKSAPVPAQAGVSSARIESPRTSAVLPAAPVTAPANARDVVVETDLYTATFSTQGAALRKLVLKKYEETIGKPVKSVTLFDEHSPSDFTLRTRAAGIPVDPVAVYAADADSLHVTDGEKKRLVFQWSSPQGLRLTKTYEFEGNKYRIVIDQQVTNLSGTPLSGNLQLLVDHRYDPAATQGRFEVNGPVYLVDGKFVSKTVKDLSSKEQSFSNGVAWTGFADKYFLSAVLADGGKIASVTTQAIPGANKMESLISSPQLSVGPGSAVDVKYDLYFGPKDLDILKAQGKGLEQSLDLGWFSALAKPLLHVLKYFYRYTGNYGVAIIIITVILKMFFFPLTYKSYKSMKGMQKLQPKMNALKEKYKNDREAMNREIMKLYQEHKVNPLGGCLPMVVQIPVFFALYKALMFSIELRHAPFVFWIQDLAAKDPTYVTPVIMGITMFVQQKMTPSNMDPAQQKIMLALPVVFTFMFINFPSGLVLYWLVNNILTIGQQYYINRQLKD